MTTWTPLQDRFAKASKTKGRSDELDYLAETAIEVADVIQDLECHLRNFAAEVEMLGEAERGEKAEILSRLRDVASQAAAGLEEFSGYVA